MAIRAVEKSLKIPQALASLAILIKRGQRRARSGPLRDVAAQRQRWLSLARRISADQDRHAFSQWREQPCGFSAAWLDDPHNRR